MKYWYKVCIDPKRFQFWGGAKSTVKYLEPEEIEDIWSCYLDDRLLGEIPDETEINDFFWFETDEIANFLGFKDFDELMEARRHI